MSTPDLFDYATARDEAMNRVECNAGAEFAANARAHVLDYLLRHGPTPGEVIVSDGEASGILAHESRAWGPVFGWLSRAKLIERDGYCLRTKGHGTAGGIVWRLTV